MAADRRRFLRVLGGVVPGVVVAGCGRGATSTPSEAQLDDALLRALAEVVLPTELGQEGIRRVQGDFMAWLIAYRPAAEVLHGYGTGELEYQPEHPGPDWAAQLRSLDLESIARFGEGFAVLDVGRRRELVRRGLSRARVVGLPTPASASLVAVGLFSFFYQSAEATDLCYGARIDPLGCRPLDAVERVPEPLTP